MVFDLLLDATIETLYMLVLSTFFALVLGFPLGVFALITGKGHLWEQKGLHQVLDSAINVLRSFPFIILMILLFPLSRILTGTSIGSTAAIVPLAIGAAPFVARMVESALAEVDHGLIEASQSMGASNFDILCKVIIPEAAPSLIAGLSITMIQLVGYSSMAGAIGAGGLGDVAIRYGYQRFQVDIMCYSIFILLILVQGIQFLSNLWLRKRREKLEK